MGALHAELRLLADASVAAQRFISVFIGVYVLLILAYVLMSWIRPPQSLAFLARFLEDVCGPYLRLFRRFIPPLGPIDVSPIVAVFALLVAEQLAHALIARIL